MSNKPREMTKEQLEAHVKAGTAMPLDYCITENYEGDGWMVMVYRGVSHNGHPFYTGTSSEPTKELALQKAQKRIFSAGLEGCTEAIERFNKMHGGQA